MLQMSWKLVGIKGLHGEICRRIKIRGRLSSSHAHRCTGEWNPCAQNSSTSLTSCVSLQLPKLPLWYALKVRQCASTDSWVWRGVPTCFPWELLLSQSPGLLHCPGGHPPCGALRSNRAGAAPLPEAGICAASGSFAVPRPMGTRPCPAGDITWTLQAPPCLPGLLQLSPTSTSLPKTQALWTPELIWSNIYSVIKKLFISLSDDKIMVE